jgi:hypothetical protein
VADVPVIAVKPAVDGVLAVAAVPTVGGVPAVFLLLAFFILLCSVPGFCASFLASFLKVLYGFADYA